MLDYATDFLTSFWRVLAEMAPYLLFGFLVAGILSVAIPARSVERHLGGRGLWPVLKATLVGIPLPLCSCSVIPVTASLLRHGASPGAATAFLLSAPQTGADSILVTFSLLGAVFAIFRPLASLFVGILGGALVSFFERTRAIEQSQPAAPACCHEPCCEGPRRNAIARILRYGFRTLPRDIGPSLAAGIAVAGAITICIPEGFFMEKLGGGIGPMLVMMALGLPIYVCATASVPIAAAFIAKGVSPGAAFVFLMTGPATNAATIATVWTLMGRRTALVYLLTVAGSALLFGVLLDAIHVSTGAAAVEHLHGHELLPPLVEDAAAVVLLLVLGAGFFGRPNDAPP